MQRIKIESHRKNAANKNRKSSTAKLEIATMIESKKKRKKRDRDEKKKLTHENSKIRFD